MGIVIALSDCTANACEHIAECSCSPKGVAWLLPDSERALSRRKKLAAKSSPQRLGCTVSTLMDWVDDRWELFGDGRAIVNDAQRQLIMRSVLESTGEFPLTSGFVSELCRMVQQGFGLPSFAAEMEGPSADLSETEERMIRVARAYARSLSEWGMCERGESMQLLASRPDIDWPDVVCEGFAALSREEASFFAMLSESVSITFVVDAVLGSRFDTGELLALSLRSAGAEVLREDMRDAVACLETQANELKELAAALYFPDAQSPVQAEGAVCVLLPAGRYAQSAMIAQAVRKAEGSILIACNDPAAMFDELSSRILADEDGGEPAESACCDMRMEVRYSRDFCQTDFGSAFLNAVDILKGEALDTFQGTDFALSSLTDMGLFAAYAYDAKWRGNRLTDVEGVLDDLCDRAPDTAAPFIGSLESGRWEDAFDIAEARYRGLSDATEAFRAEQLAAISCARRILKQAFHLGISWQEALPLLEQASVCVHLVAEGGDCVPGTLTMLSRVVISAYGQAACNEPASFDVVFACNLNASEQPLREKRSSVDELFVKLGSDLSRNVLFEARLNMLRLVRIARKQMFFVRALHDEDTEPTYSAVVLEDVVDCYRLRHADASELDKATSLPSSLLQFSEQRGEEHLTRNLSALEPSSYETFCVGRADEASSEERDKVLLPPRLSPSSIEDYLDCPHKWFASRRLRLSELDAAFSVREKGTFIHSVLQEFYERCPRELGVSKPTLDMLQDAEKLLEDVFSSRLSAQTRVKPSDNPLIPLSEMEYRQVEAMLIRLKEFLARDAQLLPGFEPSRFEFSFGRDLPFEYAGLPLLGTIDRIDVDHKGRAVVIDYKSSLSDRYFLLPAKAEGFELPAKVQTLIYAQVVRRVLGLDVVGALYVNTQKTSSSQPAVCGAYDDSVLGPESIPSIAVKRNALSCAGYSSFHDLLDDTEQLIAVRLGHLIAGEVPVCPRSENACLYCPVLACEGRL